MDFKKSKRIFRDVAIGAAAAAGQAAYQGVKRRITEDAYKAGKRAASHISTPVRNMVERYAGAPRRWKYRRPVEYGTIGRKYRRPRRTGASKYALNGVVHKLENRSTETDPDCLYVGGTTLPAGPMIRAVCSAVVRRIFSKSQFAMVDESRGILPNSANPNLSLLFVYKDAIDGGLKAVSSNSSTDLWTRYDEMADRLKTMLYTAASSTNSYFELVEIRVYPEVAATVTSTVSVTLNASEVYLDIVGTMNVQIQNRTPASAGAADPENADNILANPLRGKIYDCRKGVATFKYNNDSTAPTGVLQPNESVGIMWLAANNANLTSEMQTAIKKPPPAYAFDYMKGSAYFKQDPGKIRRLKRVTRRKMTLKSFCSIMSNALQLGDVTNAYNPLGQLSFVGLEKLCDLETGVTPVPVTVGFDYNHTISVVAWTRNRNAVLPKVTIL